MKIGWMAGAYRWLEYAAFGRALEGARFRYLSRLSDAGRVLVLGEGDGRALARLLAAAPLARIEVVETSAEMLVLARRRAGGAAARVQFRQADAREGFGAGPFDGVVTLFFLDCLTESDARAVVQQAAESLLPGGRWLLSDFALPERGWRRAHAAVWLWAMYGFFGLTTGLRARELPPLARLLRGAGLTLVEAHETRGGLIRAEVWEK